MADLEADVEEEDVDWSEDEDEDPNVKRAIEESLADNGKGTTGARTDGEGEPIRSLDVTDARETRTGTIVSLAPPVDLGATTAGAGRNANGSRSRDHSAHGYGQGANDNIRTPKPQRSFRSAVSSNSQNSSRHERENTATMVDGDAELAALVAGMNFAAPARTPPPPPVAAQPVEERGKSKSLPIAVPGVNAARGIVSAESSRKSSSRRLKDRLEAPATPDIRRSGSVPPVSSPADNTMLFGQGSPELHPDVEADSPTGDGEDDGEDTAEVGTALAVNTRSGMSRTNTPNALSPDSIPSPHDRRGSTPAAVEIGGPECPMTPRNDAGPFILDGSAGR